MVPQAGRAEPPACLAVSGLTSSLGPVRLEPGQKRLAKPRASACETPDHPDVVTGRSNIAYWTGQSGDARDALRLFGELLPDWITFTPVVPGHGRPDASSTRLAALDASEEFDSSERTSAQMRLIAARRARESRLSVRWVSSAGLNQATSLSSPSAGAGTPSMTLAS